MRKPPQGPGDATVALQASIRADGPDTVTRVRVDVDRIDKLVKLVGELTVVKNGIAHVAGLAEADIRSQSSSRSKSIRRFLSGCSPSCKSVS